jgi:hypothetical protein
VKREHSNFVPSGNSTMVPGDKMLMITDDFGMLAEICKTRGISGFRITS